MTENAVNIVVSGSSWMGSGFVSVETALIRLLEEAESEVLIVAYTIT